jgi:hypothetical protein
LKISYSSLHHRSPLVWSGSDVVEGKTAAGWTFLLLKQGVTYCPSTMGKGLLDGGNSLFLNIDTCVVLCFGCCSSNQLLSYKW